MQKYIFTYRFLQAFSDLQCVYVCIPTFLVQRILSIDILNLKLDEILSSFT